MSATLRWLQRLDDIEAVATIEYLSSLRRSNNMSTMIDLQNRLDVPKQWLQSYPSLPFVVLGVLLIGSGSLHAWTYSDTPAVTVALLLLPCGAGLSLLYASYRVSKSQMSMQNALRVLIITLTLTAIALLIAGYTVLLQASTSGSTGGPLYSLLVTIATGTALGAPLGFYYVRLQEINRDLDAQYQRTLTLNKRLSVAHRVLRHNLRNELTILAGIADTWNKEPTTEQVVTYAPVLDTHIDRLLEITTKAQLLDRVWSPTELERFDVGAVVEDSLQSVQATHSTVEIDLEIPDTAPALAHPLFPEAVDELVENAVEHNDPEDLAIEAAVKTEGEPHQRTRVEIADTGTGIPEMEIAALSQSTEEPLSHGTGLGLWLVYSLTVQSGGDLSFEENTPSGTVVQIELPAPETGQSSRQPASKLHDLLSALKLPVSES